MFSILQSNLVNRFEPLSMMLKEEIDITLDLMIKEQIVKINRIDCIFSSKLDSMGVLRLVANKDCIVCGAPWVDHLLIKIGGNYSIEWHVTEGSHVLENDPVCTIKGNVKNLVSFESILLFFIEKLSKIATDAKYCINLIPGIKIRNYNKITTLPSLKYTYYYSLDVGGVEQESLEFTEEIFISNNQLIAFGNITTFCQTLLPSYIEYITIEVTTLAEIAIAVQYGIRSILFRSFLIEDIQKASELIKGKGELIVNCGFNVNIMKQLQECGILIFALDLLLNDHTDYFYTLDVTMVYC